MRNVAISVLVVFTLGAVIVATLSASDLTKEAAKPIAGSLVAAIPVVHQLLQQSGSRLSLSARKRGVVARDGYAMPLFMLALYGFLILYAVYLIAGALVSTVAIIAGVAQEDLAFVSSLGLLPTMIAAYLVGTWIGIRSESRGIVAVMAIALAVPFVDRTLLLAFASRESVSAYFHTTSIAGLVLFPVAVSGLLIGLPAAVGHWRGRVAQSSRYLSYLLRALPEESQDALVNLAYDEAKRLASNVVSNPGGTPA